MALIKPLFQIPAHHLGPCFPLGLSPPGCSRSPICPRRPGLAGSSSKIRPRDVCSSVGKARRDWIHNAGEEPWRHGDGT